MKKLLLLTKTLLAAVLLCVGQNAWGETVNVNSTESAYVLKDSETNYDGTSNALVARYTQYRNWGSNDGTANFRDADAKLVLYKFSLADFKSAEGSMTSATLTFTTTSTENCYNIFAVGYKEDWSASTVTGKNLINKVGTITGVVTATGSFQPLGTGYAGLSNGSKATDISIDATTYIQSALDAGLDYVSFAVGINLTRSLPLNTTAKISGEFTAAAATKYTVKYQNAGGDDLKDAVEYDTFVGETFTASASDMATFYNGDSSKKYVYASGNTTPTAVADAASNVITLVFNEYDKIAYTVTAKDGETSLGTLSSGNAYTDGSIKVYWNKFKNFDDQWYETTADYGKTITVAGNTDVAFTASNIAYFYEFETLSRSGGSATVTENSISRSNNTVGRMANSSGSYATLYTPSLSAGVYTLNMPYYNGNGVTENDKVYVYITNDVASLGDPVETFDIENTNTGNFTTTLTVPEGYFVAFQGAKYYSQNSKARIDYLTLTPKVSVEVTAAGYATYVNSDYDLDFSATSIEAYKVKVSSKGVATLTKVNNVPANTPVLLYKEGGATENIPVMVGAAAVSDNDLVAGNSTTATEGVATKDGDYTNMILNNVSGIGFYFANGQTVAANRAYLHIATSLAPDAVGGARMAMLFAGSVTGVDNVEAAAEAKAKDGKYIEGNQLYIYKKGVKFNAAGQQVK